MVFRRKVLEQGAFGRGSFESLVSNDIYIYLFPMIKLHDQIVKKITIQNLIDFNRCHDFISRGFFEENFKARVETTDRSRTKVGWD